MATFTVCVVVMATCCCSGMSAMSLQPKAEQEMLLNDVLAGLSQAVGFFLSDYQNLNIDSVIAVRLCQASLLGSLHDCASNDHHCPEELTLNISAINDQLTVIHDEAVPIIRDRDEPIYTVVGILLEAALNVTYISEQLANSAKETGVFVADDISVGDSCFSSLLGTYSAGIFPKCTISDECWRSMTRRATRGYYTTHQLLYTIFGQHMGCDQELERRVLGDGYSSLRDHQKRLCQQIYLDAVSLVDNGTVQVMLQDLFMEQIGFCGILGFNTILQDEWIPMILGWQAANGCFTLPMSPEVTDPPAQTTTDETPRESGDGNERVNEETKAQSGEGNEMNMRRYCVSHKTGVGIIAMGAYVRHMVTQLHADHSSFVKSSPAADWVFWNMFLKI